MHIREFAEARVEQLTRHVGGRARRRIIVLLAAVLALDSADSSTIGTLSTQLKTALHIGNTQIGILLAVTSFFGAICTVPVGVLVDRINRTRLLALAIAFWGVAMAVGGLATSYVFLLSSRVVLGAVIAAAGPSVASLLGDWFEPAERGRIYGFVLSGELIGAGVGFVATGDIAAMVGWRAAFWVLVAPAGYLAWLMWHVHEPARGGASWLPREPAEHTTPEAQLVESGSTVRTIVRRANVAPRADLVLARDPARMSLSDAVRYVVRIPTNLVIIVASALGYYFFAGIRGFGVEYMKGHYGIGQAAASSLILVLGAGALVGVLVGGRLADRLLKHGHITARVVVSIAAFGGAIVLFAPAFVTHRLAIALPLLTAAAFCLAAINPPADAARLDILPPRLWGRAEAVRTVLRTLATALAPVVFGYISQHGFGGGDAGLTDTFLVMLAPLVASLLILLIALRTYPPDVATAAASVERERHFS